MTARDLRVLGAGYMAGCFMATAACLLSIALETRSVNRARS